MIYRTAITALLVSMFCFGNALDKTPQPALIVSGTAEVRAIPDHAVVRLGVLARAPTAGQAQQGANEIMQKMLQRLAALRIDKKDLQTSSLILNPVYDNQPRETPKIVGYEARNTISVTVLDLSLIGKVVDAGVEAGANNVEGVSFGLRDDKEAKLKALRDAVTSAREKASAIAAAANVDLVSIIEIVETGAIAIPPPMMDGRMMREGLAASTPIEPGRLTISASVTIKYAIKGK